MPRVKVAEMTEAVRAAATLAGLPTTETVAVQRAPLTRTAGVRKELAGFGQYRSWEELTAAYAASAGTIGDTFDVRSPLNNLLNWSVQEGQPSKVTKATVKKVTALLGSHYVQTVEMLGFAAAVSPLLDANRLLNVIATASEVDSAYAPERYLTRFHRDLSRLLTDGVTISPERVEALAKDLWIVVHSGRYWDVTGGAAPLREAHRQAVERAAREQAEVARYVEGLLGDAGEGTPEANRAVVRGIADMSLPYNDQTARLVAELPHTDAFEDALADIGRRSRRGEWVNPDTLVLCSLVDWLRPDDRPESPASWLVDAAVSAWHDQETGQLSREGWPAKPKAWLDMYPTEPVGVKFPLPSAVYKLHQTALPGTDYRMVLIRTPQELAENRAHMGNCTWMYQAEMERGAYALFRFSDGKKEYNAAMVLDTNTGQWRWREVNSRFNLGGVTQEVEQGFRALIAGMPVVNVH